MSYYKYQTKVIYFRMIQWMLNVPTMISIACTIRMYRLRYNDVTISYFSFILMNSAIYRRMATFPIIGSYAITIPLYVTTCHAKSAK